MLRKVSFFAWLALAGALANVGLAEAPLAPVIYSQPQSRTVKPNTVVTFKVDANGYPALNYRWRRNGTTYSSSSTNTGSLTVLASVLTNNGDFDVVITNGFGAVTSVVATLTVVTQAVSISQEPAGQVACSGATVFLNAQAGGLAPVGYKWRLNGVDLPGAGAASLPNSNFVQLVLSAVSAANTGDYTLVVSNAYGALTSAVATVTVDPPAPVITQHPRSQTAAIGSAATLFVSASACTALSYQWHSNGVDLAGATGSSLTFSNATSNLSAQYDVLVSSASGSVLSRTAWLVVTNSPPTITCQPQSRSVPAGSSATFSVCANGQPPLAYQWRHNGALLSQPTNAATYVVTSALPPDAGDYDVIVSNASGAATSAVATLTITSATPPTILTNPQSRSVTFGQTAFFTVLASGTPTPSYQWQKNGFDLPGKTTSTLVLSNTTLADAADYRAVASNAGGSATSAVATLAVLMTPPTILTNPQSQTVSIGQTTYFNVKASGAPPPAYQWRKDGTALSGQTNASLIISSTALADAGDYSAIAYNAAGTATSAVANLTVTLGSPPVIESQPQDQTVYLSFPTNATFSVYATGTGPLGYQWFHNGAAVANASPPGIYSTLTLWPPVTAADAGDYIVVVWNAAGSVTSQVARLTVTPFPIYIYAVSTYSQGGSVELGSPRETYFSSYVYATEAVSYQWFHNGQSIAAATNSDLILGPMTMNDSGGYFLVATNSFGAATSRVATITVVIDPPSIYAQPGSENIVPGTTTGYISVGAIGAFPMDFRWFHDGVPIPSTLFDPVDSLVYFNPATTNDAGSYFVVVSNVAGVVTSVVAYVTVEYIPLTILSQPISTSRSEGAVIYFCVNVAGSPPITYQWQHAGTNLLSATNSCYGFAASTNTAGDYQVMVGNPIGSVTSIVAHLTVIPRPPGPVPVFVTQPVVQDAGLGAGVTLSASSTNALSFQWQYNGQNIPNPDGGGLYAPSFLWLDDIQTNQAGNYTVVLTNYDGAVTSRVVSLTVPSGPLDHWQWRNPQPQGNDVYHAAYGNGTIVAVGRQGAKVVSTDGGATWQAHNQSGAFLVRVAYGNGIFVGVSPYWLEARSGTGYRLQTSTDGVHWTDRNLGLTDVDQTMDVAFGNGRFVAVANFGGVIVSTNGVDWVKSQWTNYWNLGRVTFGNGLFVITDRGGPTVSVAISSDGLTWTNGTLSGAGYMQDLAFGNGQFICWGRSTYGLDAKILLTTSPDGVSWTTRQLDITNTLSQVAAGNGKLVAVGSTYGIGWLASSSDGVTWRDHSASVSNGLYGIAFCNDRFVALGNHGNILTSTDGESWQPINKSGSTNLRSMSRGNGRSVAVGNEGTVFTSTDGASWTRLSLPTTSNLRGIAFGAGMFVAVGASEGTSNTLFTSTDGLGWTRQPLGSFNTPTGGVIYAVYDLYNVAYGAGTFVAVGDNGALLTSSNGLAWNALLSGTSQRLNSVTYGADRFVAVGKKGWIVQSLDGVHWWGQSYSYLLNSSTHFLQGIAYGNGRYVAVGHGGGLLVSSNAANWTAPLSPLAVTARDIEDVQFANGLFIAVGAGGLIATSPDGVLWTTRYSGSGNDLRGAFYADCRFFAVGNNETILESGFNGPPMLQAAAPSGGGFQFSVSGEMGVSYRLQVSTNLNDWTDLLTFTNAQGITPWHDTNAMSHPRRFYRVVSP